MKERKRKITTITVIGLMLILAITTFTYAIWSRTHTQTGTNRNTYACFEISYAETNGDGISMENGIPQKDEEGLKNKPYEVQITNTCDTVSTYNVILNKENTSDLDDEHLKVAVDNDYKLLSQATSTDKRTIQGFSNEASYIIGTGVVGPNQTKIVQIRSWMDKDTTETDGENKSFTFKITIEAGAGVGDLKTKIFGKEYAVITETPDFSTSFPNQKTTEEEVKAKSGLYLAFDDDGTSYYFRGDVKNNYVQLGINSENKTIYTISYNIYTDSDYIQGYEYTYEEAVEDCQTDYNIYADGSSPESCIASIKEIKISEENTPSLWRIVRINGDGTIRLIKDTPMDWGSFNYNRDSDIYAGYTYNNRIACTKENPCISDYNGNSFKNSEGVGTNSDIKNKLEDWYKINLAKYDDKIALTTFCNDTSYGKDLGENEVGSGEYDFMSFGATKRNSDKNYTLSCINPNSKNDETKNYGGVYKLKIGLLTTDEMGFAGLSNSTSTYDNNNYLYHNYYWWSLSPCSYGYYGTGLEYYVDFYLANNNGFIASDSGANAANAILPVINLKSDVTVTGTGTQKDPYVVQ